MRLNSLIGYFLKWSILALLIGILSGLASGIFLYSLELVTNFRVINKWIIWFLPFGGFLIG